MDIQQIRNVGIIAHGGAGKTTLAEALLFNAKATDRMGKVDDGSSNFDYDPEEIRRKITINTSFHHYAWDKVEVTLADTPGYINFEADTRSCLTVLDGAVLLVNAVSGVEVQTEKMWSLARGADVPVIAFVSKMDRERADPAKAVEEIADILKVPAVPVQLADREGGGVPRRDRPVPDEGDGVQGRHRRVHPPGDPLRPCRRRRARPGEARRIVRRVRRRADREVPRGDRPHRRGDPGRFPGGGAGDAVPPGPLRLRVAQHRDPAGARPRQLRPSRSLVPGGGRGNQPEEEGLREAPHLRGRAVLRPGLQDAGGPVCREALHLQDLFRHAHAGYVPAEFEQGRGGADRPDPAAGGEEAEGARVGLRGGDRRGGEIQGDVHGGHAVRSEGPDRLRRARPPWRRSSPSRSARRRATTRTSWAAPSPG